MRSQLSPELVPLSTAAPLLAEALPECVPVQRIGINEGAIGSVAGWAGFRSYDLQPVSGDTSNISGVVAGIDGPNTAVMGGVARTTVPLGKAEAGEDDSKYWRSRVDATLTINTNELTRNLCDTGAVLREPDAWAQGIHDAIAQALRAGAKQNLMRWPVSSEEWLYEAPKLAVGGLAVGVSENVQDASASLRHTMVLVTIAYAQGATQLMKRLMGDREAVIHSAVPLFPLDRLAMVALQTRLRRFAAPIPKTD